MISYTPCFLRIVLGAVWRSSGIPRTGPQSPELYGLGAKEPSSSRCRAMSILIRDCRGTQPRGLAIERLDHPDGEVDVDSPLLVTRTPRPRQIEILCDVFAGLEPPIEVLRLSLQRV